MGLASGLLQIGAIAAAAFALQAFVKRFGRAGRMPAQVIGAIGLTSTSAGAYFVSIGKLDHVAFALWLANWLFAGDQIHFVQVRIRGSRLADAPAKVRQGYGFLGGQVLLLLVIGFLCNLMVKAVHHRFHMHPEHEAERAQIEVGAIGEPAGV